MVGNHELLVNCLHSIVRAALPFGTKTTRKKKEEEGRERSETSRNFCHLKDEEEEWSGIIFEDWLPSIFIRLLPYSKYQSGLSSCHDGLKAAFVVLPRPWRRHVSRAAKKNLPRGYGCSRSGQTHNKWSSLNKYVFERRRRNKKKFKFSS